MATTISCPSCTRKLTLPDHALGKYVRCPACSHTFLAEDSPSPAAITLSRAPAEPAPIPYAEEVREPRHSRKESRRARSGRGWLLAGGIVLVAMMVLATGLAGVLWIVFARTRTPAPPVVARQRPELLREQVRQAFGDRPLADAPVPEEPELRVLFNEWNGAFKARDPSWLKELVNLERLYDEVAAQGGAELQDRILRREVGNRAADRILKTLLQDAHVYVWTSLEIRSVTRYGGKEMAVITQQQCDAGFMRKMRWWLTRASGTLKIFDLEDLDTGLRFSMGTGMAFMLRPGPQRTMLTTTAPQLLEEINDARNQGKLDEADGAVKRALKLKVPPHYEALFHFLQGLNHLKRKKHQQALECFNRAHRLNPNMLVLDLMRGVALNRLGKWDRALEALQAYHDLLGDEVGVCLQMGEAYRGKTQFGMAAASYRKALDCSPENVDAFLGLNYSLSCDNRDEISKRFELLPDRAQAFKKCVEALQQANRQDAVAQLAEVMHRLEPESALASYHLSVARARTGHWEQAGPLFRNALAREKDAGKRLQYLDGFLQAAVQAGKAAEGYSAAPEPRDAFANLTDHILKSYRTDQLRPLAALHATKDAGDPLLPFCQAEVLLNEGKYTKADRTFTAAMAHPPADAWVARFRASRVRARALSGSPLSAYEDIGPREETFQQLAYLLLANSQHDLLEKLLTEHQRACPKDPQIFHHKLSLRIEQDRVDEALDLFRVALKGPLKKEDREALVNDFLRQMAAAGSSLDAYRAAPDPDHAFQVLANALTDDEDNDYDAEGMEQLLAAYQASPSKDPDKARRLSFHEGELLVNRKKWHAAVEKFDPLWKDAPEEMQNRFRYSFITAFYHDHRVRHAYDTVLPHEQTFAQLAALLIEDHKAAELEQLIEAHRAHAPKAPELDYYAARAKVLLKQVEAGQKLLAEACKKQSNPNLRESYIRQLALDLLAVQPALEVYRSSPDRAVAFEALAGHLLTEKKAADLKALLEEHGRTNPKDPLFLYYSGELALLQGDPARAEKLFTESLALTPADRSWQPRHALTRAQVRAGTALAACKRSGWSLDSFQQLASQCMQEKDAKQLQSLVDAFRQAHPDEPSLPAWDLDLCWLRQDYEGVRKLVAANKDGVFDQPQYRWKADDYLVRSLVRLKRSAEAVETAEALSRKGRGSSLLLVLAHAAHGGAADALNVMEKASRRRLYPYSCYQDPDLGPLLRSPAFADFRKKFPEPSPEG